MTLCLGWIVVNDVKALLANVIDQPLNLPPVIIAFDQTQIENRCGCRGNDVAGQRAHVTTTHAIDIQ